MIYSRWERWLNSHRKRDGLARRVLAECANEGAGTQNAAILLYALGRNAKSVVPFAVDRLQNGSSALTIYTDWFRYLGADGKEAVPFLDELIAATDDADEAETWKEIRESITNDKPLPVSTEALQDFMQTPRSGNNHAGMGGGGMGGGMF